MASRPATTADRPEIIALHQQWEQHWLGAAELDADEIAESLDRAAASRVVIEDGRMTAAAWWQGPDSVLVTDPDGDARSAGEELVAWFETQEAPQLDVFSGDAVLRDLLEARGWTYARSSYELLREVTPDFTLDPPVWPEGISARDLRPDDVAALHHLIYVDAAWGSVPGHPERALEQWREIFRADLARTDQQVLAWAGDRLVGAATGRIFSDGAGWIAQLAVARDQQRRGLGRALLLEGLRRRLAAGATTLGLSVEAANPGALRLYQDVGLRIDREWRHYARPTNRA